MAAKRGFFKYYEGTVSSKNLVKELAWVLSTGVREDAGNEEIPDNQKEIMKKNNWDIVYPLPGNLGSEYESLSQGTYEEDEYSDIIDNMPAGTFRNKVESQVNKITDHVILRTTVNRQREDNNSNDKYDDFTVDPEVNEEYHTMYLEIFKPKYLADPEKYPLDCERHGIIPKVVTKEMFASALNGTASFSRNIYDELNLNKEEKYVRIDNRKLVDELKEAQKEIVDVLTNIHNVLDNTSEPAKRRYSTSYTNNPAPFSNGVDVDNLRNYVKDGAPSHSLNWTIDKFELNILKNSVEGNSFYYDLINRLNITEQDFVYIEYVDLHISWNDEYGKFEFSIMAHKKVTVYTVTPGTVYHLPEDPFMTSDATEALKPTLYVNGTYMPLPSMYYSSNNNSITFNEAFSFSGQKYDGALEGLLTIRYDKTRTKRATNFNDVDITENTTILNNHYVIMRMFDNINYTKDGPSSNHIDENGNVTEITSHVSPWAKLSWYKDFEEIMVDSIDEDYGVASISDGTIFVPIETPGLSNDTKLKYWINTNAERFTLVLMGNPSLDYEKERHLISTCYCGAIDSFANSINDVSGNFALFTSSSTEPCYTTLDSIETRYPMKYRLGYPTNTNTSSADYYDDGLPTDVATFISEIREIGGELSPKIGHPTYYVNLPSNSYFIEDEHPMYAVINGNTVISSYRPVESYKFETNKSSDKSSKLIFNVDPDFITNDNYKIYVNFGYYVHKYVINSGVTRDIFGNVVDVKKEQSYGLNTSDGVTSIMMYHTRSKAYYQKHHMLFATTEEYMSKVMYGKSAYTGEYYADRIKVTHGNDGPRGILKDMLVIDNSSLYASDELVVNKDFKNDEHELEETYIYFPITAPYSPLSDSPNALYGIAIKKNDREIVGDDRRVWIEKAIEEVDGQMENAKNINSSNINLPGSAYYDKVKVYWKDITDTNEEDAGTVNIYLSNRSGQYNDINHTQSAKLDTLFTISNKDYPNNEYDTFHVRLTNVNPGTQLDNIKFFYGISDTEITDTKKGDIILKEFNVPFSDEYIIPGGTSRYTKINPSDGMEFNFTYSLSDKPVYADTELIIEEIDNQNVMDIELHNVKPSQWFTLYATVVEGEDDDTSYTVSSFKSIMLTSEHLKYPNNVIAIRGDSKGKVKIQYTTPDNRTSDASTGAAAFVSAMVCPNTQVKVITSDVEEGYTIDTEKTMLTIGNTQYAGTSNALSIEGREIIIPQSYNTEDMVLQVCFKQSSNS